MQEAFDIALHARVPVVVSHLKCAGAGNWGRTKEVLFKLENAGKMQRVGCDCYPYSASSSTLDLKQVTDEFDIIINWSAPHPDQAGRKLAEIAADWNVTLLEAARRLQPAGAVYHNMHEDDVRRVLSHPLTMVGSDGLPNDPKPHPRLWGAFPRVLGHYSRDAGLFPLNQAVHKMTGLSAARYGGRTRPDPRGLSRRRGAVQSGHRDRPRHLRRSGAGGGRHRGGLGQRHPVLSTRAAHRRTRRPLAAAQWRPARKLRGGVLSHSLSKEHIMSNSSTTDSNGITRYGVAGGTGQGGSHMPFARAVAADGWLYVSGQVPMENGEVIEGGTVAQSHKAIQQVLAILKEAGYGPEHVVRCGVAGRRARFPSFNKVFRNTSAKTRRRAPACSRR